ncbi:MAG TPA: hypothetical protein VLC12_09740, partial [Terriglobales bacterium]|nr:hypothetical protein [Terriglobales bacterium]
MIEQRDGGCELLLMGIVRNQEINSRSTRWTRKLRDQLLAIGGIESDEAADDVRLQGLPGSAMGIAIFGDRLAGLESVPQRGQSLGPLKFLVTLGDFQQGEATHYRRQTFSHAQLLIKDAESNLLLGSELGP